MRVTATVPVLADNDVSAVKWSSMLRGTTLLERVIRSAQQVKEIDGIAVLTNISELIKKNEIQGVPVMEIWPWAVIHRFDFLTCDSSVLGQQELALQKSGMNGDVHFTLNWQMPLVSSTTLERMYHCLLESKAVARIVPIYPIDPNIYMDVGGKGETPFSVWSQPGRDRQEVPQLFRTWSLCVHHKQRLAGVGPTTTGFRIPRLEALEIKTTENMNVAEFVLERMSHKISNHKSNGTPSCN